MRVLVASNKHGLLPFAWRLKREGAEVQVLVWKDAFQEVWEGRLPKVLKGGEKNPKALGRLAERAREEGWVVLSDSERGRRVFGGEGMFGKVVLKGNGENGLVALGGWFDGRGWREELDHLLVQDWGLWPGGMGAEVLGGAVLRRGSTRLHRLAWERLEDALRAQGFRGLVNVQVGLDGRPGRVEVGWPFLQSDAFVSCLSSLRGLLEGNCAVLEKRFVVVVPVTRAPWPFQTQGGFGGNPAPIEGLGGGEYGNVFLRDFRVNGEGWPETGGTDGMVAVVRGSGDGLGLARARALGLAGRMRFPERQVRGDVGAQAQLVLEGLEEQGLFDTTVESAVSAWGSRSGGDFPIGDEGVNSVVEDTGASGDGEGGAGELGAGDDAVGIGGGDPFEAGEDLGGDLGLGMLADLDEERGKVALLMGEDLVGQG